ncbi:MAG TPA: choice-of-anchor Q domain-containing protein [Blastocatellia bacterium]|nr:choice-of-anchor Q domain-containing protein [Blastocatellia bacterium]
MNLTPFFDSLRRCTCAARLLIMLSLLGGIPALAATFNVTNNNDAGAGSLRDAVTQANGAAGADTITFAANVTGTITLTTGELVITEALTINGPGANLLTISGNNASRVFYVSWNVAVTITGLTLTRGNGEGANDAGSGGSIYSRGALTLTNCHITGNTANFTGGGVALQNAEGIFTGCTFSNNTAGSEGGGIFYQGGDNTLTLVNCTITGNQANGNGRGAGILNQAFCGDSTLQVNNCTIANNISAEMSGGGIRTEADGGECRGVTAQTFLRSTIVANNTLPNLIAFANDGGNAVVTSQGFNLASDNGSGFLNQPTDILNANPQLGALANNGGPTPTLAIPDTSPALDKGNSFGLTTDQRGLARTVNFPAANAAGADGTDIGAFELAITGEAPLTIQVADPAICIDPNGLVAATATLTNPTGAPAQASFTANLPPGLTTVPGTCSPNVNAPGCTLAPASVTWTGTLNAGQTVTIIYRMRITGGVVQGSQFCLALTGNVGPLTTNLTNCFTVNCPLINARVSDQKAGSVLVFPYYTSTVGGVSDTRMTISNIGTGTGLTFVHLFLIDGASCQQSDLFLCLTPNASFSFKASDYDPGNTGYVLAVAVNAQGVPIQNNVLIGNAFVNTPQVKGNYGAESFRANSFAVATIEGNAATLYFDQVGYDAVPKQFAVEVQSPADATGQQVVTAGLSGNLVTSQVSGAAQVGVGQAFNEREVFASFSNWLTGICQARATISTTTPRVPNGLGNLIKTGQSGTLKFNVGGAVGVLLTPEAAPWKGIRTLHKTQTTATTLTIPIFIPTC